MLTQQTFTYIYLLSRTVILLFLACEMIFQFSKPILIEEVIFMSYHLAITFIYLNLCGWQVQFRVFSV